MSLLTLLRFRARVLWTRIRRGLSLDTLVPVILALVVVLALYTAANVTRIVENQAASDRQHAKTTRDDNARQLRELQQVKAIIQAEIAAALRKHDRETARQLEITLHRLERLLTRPARIIERDGRERVVIITPQPAPTPNRPGKGKR